MGQINYFPSFGGIIKYLFSKIPMQVTTQKMPAITNKILPTPALASINWSIKIENVIKSSVQAKNNIV